MSAFEPAGRRRGRLIPGHRDDPAGARPDAGSPAAARILALQRTAGNATVVRLVAGDHAAAQPASSGRDVVVQRASLNLRAKATASGRAAGTISGVSGWPSRPASNLRGKQGQHLTAYVVFENTIEHRVIDKTPQTAATALNGYLDEITKLPGMEKATAAYLTKALAAVSADLLVAAATPDPKVAAATVGAAIDTILSIRNQVPGTAQHGVGGGHGEAGTAGIVTEVEKALRNGETFPALWSVSTPVEDQVRHAAWRLLAYDPPVNADPKDVIAALTTHYMSLRSAYPYTFAWLSGNSKMYLAPYLLAHSPDGDLPMQQWIAAKIDLGPIFMAVYANL